MNFHKLRHRMAGAASIAIVASAGALMIGGGLASASPPADPPGGTTPVYPHFNNGNVEGIRDTGSDTTFFMVQKIGDLYTSAGLYGCTLNAAATGETLYNSSDTLSGTDEEYYCQANKNIDTTDVNDNWDRTEVTEGVDDVGSGAGQNQLCGASTLSSPLAVDFSRSSKPVTVASSCHEVGTGYAKDGVPIVDFPTVNPASYGTSTFTGGGKNSTQGATGVSYANVNGGNIGKVASGWLPGDLTSGGTLHGYQLTNITDAGNPSVAYEIWCSGTVDDWGQLTNLGGALATSTGSTPGGKGLAIVGVTVSGTTLTLPATATVSDPVTSFPTSGPNAINTGATVWAPGLSTSSLATVVSNTGTTITLSAAPTAGSNVTVDFSTTKVATGSGEPYGLPIRDMGIPTTAGIESSFNGYSEDNFTGTNACASSSPSPGLIAEDPDTSTDTGDNGTPHVALQNNASQIGLFDAADFPITGPTDTNDAANQAIELATTLYFESNGVFNTNPHSAVSDITFNGTTTAFSASQVEENGETPTTQNLLNNIYPTARTLFNIYQTTSVRASTAGFLNWICDSNTYFGKGTDQTTGQNFDNELNTIIGGNFGFIRLTDQSIETSNSPDTGFSAPDGSCGVEATGTLTNNTLTIPDTQWPGGTLPSQLTDGITVVGPDLDFAGGPNPGDTVPTTTSISDSGGTTTIGLSQTDGTTTVTGEQLTFGLPPILSVANPQT